jgi:hypothetical protein
MTAIHKNNSSLNVEEVDEMTCGVGVEVTATEESIMSSSDVAATATAPSGQKTEPRRAFVLAGALAIAAGALGIVSFAGSNIKNNGSSKQAAAVEVEGLETTKVEGYEFFGIRVCLDGNDIGHAYDFIGYEYTRDDVGDPTHCGRLCSKCPGTCTDLVLRGFQYLAANYCRCQVDNGATYEMLLGSCTSAGADFASANYLGTGEIQGLGVILRHAECWKVTSTSFGTEPRLGIRSIQSNE